MDDRRHQPRDQVAIGGVEFEIAGHDPRHAARLARGAQDFWRVDHGLEVDRGPAGAARHRPWRRQGHQQEVPGLGIEAPAIVAVDAAAAFDQLAEDDDR